MVRKELYLNIRGDHIDLLKIPKAELEKLTHLEYNNNAFRSTRTGVIDLTGLECAPQLTTLLMPGNTIRDMTPLAQLTKLTEIDFYSNKH